MEDPHVIATVANWPWWLTNQREWQGFTFSWWKLTSVGSDMHSWRQSGSAVITWDIALIAKYLERKRFLCVCVSNDMLLTACRQPCTYEVSVCCGDFNKGLRITLSLCYGKNECSPVVCSNAQCVVSDAMGVSMKTIIKHWLWCHVKKHGTNKNQHCHENQILRSRAS